MENKTQLDSEELIREILNQSKDTITANVQEQIKKSIIDNLSWSLREHISKVTNEFVEKEMKEEIQQALIDHKPIIIEALKGAFTKIGAAVAQAMFETASKNLAVGSYHVKDIVKKILD